MYQNTLYQQFDMRLKGISGITEYKIIKKTDHRCKHNYWVLDYLAEGEGLFKTSAPGRPWRVRKKGEAHLYPPNTIYHERLEKDKSIKSCFIAFECSESAGIHQLIPSLDHYALIYDEQKILLKLFQKFNSVSLLSESKQFLMGQTVFWEIMLHLNCLAPSETGNYYLNSESLFQQKSKLIQDILSWINKNYTRKMTMLDLTKEFAISRTALYQHFIKETGETPFAVINRLRLKQADDLLLQGYKLKEIAEEMGFSSEYHLSKAYKKHFGIPPGKMRKKT